MEKRGVAHLVLIVVLVVVAAVLVVSLTGNTVIRTEVEKCFDTDANNRYPDGKNYNQVGSVRLGDFRDDSYSDHCISEKILVEYYCIGDRVESIEYVCEEGCLTTKGRCDY
jgi:hypothetical protein